MKTIDKSSLYLSLLAPILAGFTAIYFAYNVINETQNLKLQSQITLQKKLQEESKDITSNINTINNTVKELTHTLVTDKSKELFASIQTLFKTLKIEGAGVALMPQHNHPVVGTHFTFDGTALHSKDITQFYTLESTNWFMAAQRAQDGLWLDPYFEAVINKIVIRFIVPIFRIDSTTKTNSFVGALYVDLDKKEVNSALNLMALGNYSQAFIIDTKKSIISSPFGDSVQTFDDIAHMPGKSELRIHGDEIITRHKGIKEFNDPLAKKDFWVIYEYVPSAEWIIVALTADTNPLTYPHIRRTLIHALVALSLFVIFLSISFVSFNNWTSKSWWISNIIISISLITLVYEILYLHHNYSDILQDLSRDQRASIISNEAELERFKQLNDYENGQSNRPPAIYVPTGILLSFIDINSENQVVLEGFVWQKYNKSIPIEKAISLLNVKSFSTEKAYELEQNQDVIIGWHFKALALNWFDFIQYPFDKQLLKLNFFHPQIEKNIILTPDFASYELFSYHPALKSNVQINSWQFKDTFFYYYQPPMKTNFGLNKNDIMYSSPDFYFALSISREIISALVMAILPLAIIAIIIFFALLQTSGIKRKLSSIASILPQLSAIFFAGIIAHQSIRRAITNANTVIFIEYYYFLIYALLLMVSINAVLYLSTTKKEGLFFTRENLIIQLLYWPTLFLFSVGITLYSFY